MIPDERRKEILELLDEKGYVSVKDLSQRLYVSLPTIRRDLTLLEREGYVLRTHGGASLSISDSFVEPFALRKKTNLEAKKYIGKIAASLIHNNDTLFITSSSTCLEFANHIKPDLRLNILTNGMPLAHKLSENNNVTVECPAGIYNYFHEGIYGKEVKELISKRYAQYCFTSCNGIDLINGLTFSTDLDMTLIRACRDNCDQLIVLADHTKFGMTYYFKTLSIKEIDVIITDQEPAEKWITYCEENGITRIY